MANSDIKIKDYLALCWTWWNSVRLRGADALTAGAFHPLVQSICGYINTAFWLRYTAKSGVLSPKRRFDLFPRSILQTNNFLDCIAFEGMVLEDLTGFLFAQLDRCHFIKATMSPFSTLLCSRWLGRKRHAQTQTCSLSDKWTPVWNSTAGGQKTPRSIYACQQTVRLKDLRTHQILMIVFLLLWRNSLVSILLQICRTQHLPSSSLPINTSGKVCFSDQAENQQLCAFWSASFHFLWPASCCCHANKYRSECPLTKPACFVQHLAD